MLVRRKKKKKIQRLTLKDRKRVELKEKKILPREIKKQLLKEKKNGNLPKNCQIKTGWHKAFSGDSISMTVAGVSMRDCYIFINTDNKIQHSPLMKKIHDVFRKIIKNNDLQNCYTEIRYTTEKEDRKKNKDDKSE